MSNGQYQTNLIYMTKGIPASGKSTWARNKLKSEDNIKRVSKDDMRDMLDNGEFSMQKEGFILDMRNEIVEAALLRGNDVIIDDTNFSDKHFNAMCQIAKRVGNVGVKEIYFDVSLREAIKRNENRDESERVPEQVIKDMMQKHVRGGVKQRDVFFPKAEHPHNDDNYEDLDKGIIVDMDGTLCKKTGDRGWYDYDRVIEDDPNVPVIRVVQAMKDQGYKVHVVTGREGIDECEEQCHTWLESFEVPYDQLSMREKDDHRPDNVIKKEIYWNEIHDNMDAEFVIDDRMSVTNMWRSLGIPTFQVAKGTF